MKNLFTLIAFLAVNFALTAQAPQKMSYQAVIRNSSGGLLTGHSVGMRISILQGTPTGTSVYVETHSTTTNANGLATIEIGGGSVVSGTFATINWGSGTYYLKTEADPAGGSSYTVVGTSQLLSVPYAFYAKTAGTGNGTVTSIATNNGITGGTITTTGTLGLTGQALALHNLATNGLVTRTGAGTFSSRTITEGTGIDVSNGNGVSGNPRISAETYSVGEFAQGGIVFWVDATGQHGLVCAKSDQSSGVRWFAGTYCKTQALGDGPMAGEMNTAIIIASQAAIGDDGATYAARLCNELKITSGSKTYGDWYLPSVEELELMYQNRAVINATALPNGGEAFAFNHYWSSTEYGPNGKSYAWVFNLTGGSSQGAEKSIDYICVRAVRSF